MIDYILKSVEDAVGYMNATNIQIRSFKTLSQSMHSFNESVLHMYWLSYVLQII